MICERCGVGHLHHRYSYYDFHERATVAVYVCDYRACGHRVRYIGNRRLD